jgi:hypothetical protein
MNDETAGFKVDFCPDMTMSYEDRDGLLKFVFEVASERRPKTVILYGGAVDAALKDIPKSPGAQARIEMAFKRVVAYLHSCGHEVDVIE